MSAIPTSSAGGKNLFPIALVIGIIGVVIAGYGVWDGHSNNDPRPLYSWLIGLAFWFSIGIGMLFMILLFHIFKASWPIVIRRQLEHAMTAFPILCLLFLPLLFIAHFGDHSDLIWNWIGIGEHEDVLLDAKSAYLNLEAFTARAFAYFFVFCGLGLFFRHASCRQDKDGKPYWTHLSLKVAAGGVIVTALSASFAAIDWFKTIEHHWFSTMYGVWFFATSMRAALAVTVIICFFLATRSNLKGLYNQAHRYELGCLMLAFTIFWAYVTFCQFFLIYNANIPEETFWYNIRQFNPETPDLHNSWYYIGMCLIFCNFLFPFFYLLFYRSKIVTGRILFIACWILFWQIADIYYNILPGKVHHGNHVHNPDAAFDYTVRQFDVTAYDFSAIIGMGALCAAAFFWSRLRTEPIPIRDPRILDSINHHE